jgi:septal ring factor EnvC (AmiA/AmiB activator)
VTGQSAEPPYDTLPPDAAATVEDVRTSRRWTVVALAWAVAASVIAVLALIQANKDDNSSADTQTQTTQTVSPKDFEDFQNQVNDRLDAFSRRLNDTASAADLQKLDKRLAQVEDDLSEIKADTGKTKDSVTQLQADVKDLQQRVDDLENQQQSQGTTP